MKSLSFAMLVLLTLLSAVSCTKEELYSYDWAPGVSKLMDEYFNGSYFESYEISDDGVTFTFQDDVNVTVNPGDIIYYDITYRDEPVFDIDYDDNSWTVNLVRTGIPVDKSLPDNQAYPVCVWFNEGYVYIFVSNGHTLEISGDPKEVLSYFSFRTTENYSLKSGISCEIDGTDVIGRCPLNMTTTKLIPTFVFRGKSITVNGVEQESGVTKQDFKNPVEYVVELYNGEKVTYTVSLISTADFPTIFITTDYNSSINSRTYYVSGSIRIQDSSADYWDTPSFEARMRIRGRGNATWNNFPKKPYRIKLDESAGIFGLPKNKDWILLANYSDKTLMRNIVAMKISEIVGMPWTPAMFPVDVYLNGKYIGNYTFCDHKEVAKHRVDIDLVAENDNSGEAVTGGYYLEIEQQLDEPVSWTTMMGVPMMFKDPSRPTQAQQAYVKGYFDELETVLTNEDFNINTGYPKYIDIDSWINYYIVNELTKNIDGNLRKSTFLTKERGQKLKMYHVWDFDFTLGNCDYFDSMYGLSNGPEDLFILKYGYQGRGSGWYYRLSHDKTFLTKVKNKWNKVYQELYELADFIDEEEAFMKVSADRNFDVWPILNTYVWPNPVIKGSYEKEVAYMREFYLQRLEWLNNQINTW